MLTTREQMIQLCQTLTDVYEDYPFDDPNWTLMRHRANKKAFAMIFRHQDHIWVNVKAQPQWGLFWRRTFSSVVPAYHMNKQHWISIILDGSIPDRDIFQMVQESYLLTAPKSRVPSGPREAVPPT